MGVGLQAATDEYIEKNDERFAEAAALLVQGREDVSGEAASAPASLSLGEHLQLRSPLGLLQRTPSCSAPEQPCGRPHCWFDAGLNSNTQCASSHDAAACMCMLRLSHMPEAQLAVLRAGARTRVLVLEASAAGSATTAVTDCASSAVAALPFAERLTTDSLIDTNSSSSPAPLDLTQVLILCPVHCAPQTGVYKLMEGMFKPISP